MHGRTAPVVDRHRHRRLAAAADRLRGAVVVVGRTDGDGARLEMSAAFMTLHRVIALVTLHTSTLPTHSHKPLTRTAVSL